ncbi:MAG: hypothetical protein H6745_12185 [Deltaproteobacteria bacterium]|nr:hypothetical protein [Deltaproteobacteria bacterium]
MITQLLARSSPSARAVAWRLLPLMAVATALGCGTDGGGGDASDTLPAACDAIATQGIRATVTRGEGGPRVCDATVAAQRTDSGVVTVVGLEPSLGVGPCSYWGFQVGLGTWDVVATAPDGATGRVDGVTVTRTADGCALLTQDVTIVVE